MTKEYTALEITFLAFALLLSFLLLLLGEAPQASAVPPLLAWMMVNRRQ